MMFLVTIQCDICGDTRAGAPGEHGHQVRHRLHVKGWKSRRRDMKSPEPYGPVDLCPLCRSYASFRRRKKKPVVTPAKRV